MIAAARSQRPEIRRNGRGVRPPGWVRPQLAGSSAFPHHLTSNRPCDPKNLLGDIQNRRQVRPAKAVTKRRSEQFQQCERLRRAGRQTQFENRRGNFSDDEHLRRE